MKFKQTPIATAVAFALFSAAFSAQAQTADKKESEKALDEFKMSRMLLDESIEWTENEAQRKKMSEYLRETTRSIAYVYLGILRQPKLAIAELKTLGSPK